MSRTDSRVLREGSGGRGPLYTRGRTFFWGRPLPRPVSGSADRHEARSKVTDPGPRPQDRKGELRWVESPVPSEEVSPIRTPSPAVRVLGTGPTPGPCERDLRS